MLTRSKRRVSEVDRVNVTRGRDGARDVEILATSAVKKERTGALRFCRCQRLCGSLDRASLAVRSWQEYDASAAASAPLLWTTRHIGIRIQAVRGLEDDRPLVSPESPDPSIL